MIHYTIYSFKYIIKSNIFEFCKNTENVKGLIYINNILLNSATQITYIAPPCKVSYKNFTGCLPTNLKYILHGLLILSYIKTIGLTSTNIVEIGGGYDGLCFYIYNMAKLFDITRGDGFTRKVFTCPRF